MNFREKLNSGKFIITSEISPPKGINTSQMLAGAKFLSPYVDALNVTELQSSLMRLGSLAASVLLKQNGYEPILQVACRDMNRLALQSELLAAAVFGIENVSLLTGDHPLQGDHPQAKAVFDLDSVQLIQAAASLRRGFDMSGNKLSGGSPDFCLGAVVNPEAEPLFPEIIKMGKKIGAGAEFFQTQAVYDVRKFKEFFAMSGSFGSRIIAGIIPLKSAKMARYMNEHIAGVSVPEDLIDEIQGASDRRKKSVEISARIIRDIRSSCPGISGVHIMPIGWYEIVPEILERI